MTTFSYAIEQLNQFKLAYVHLMEPSEDDLKTRDVINPVISTFRPLYSGLIITNGGYDKSRGNRILETGKADLVSFGKLFIANPDLPKRFTLNIPLNDLNFATIYSKSDQNLEQGYTDYPFLKLQGN